MSVNRNPGYHAIQVICRLDRRLRKALLVTASLHDLCLLVGTCCLFTALLGLGQTHQDFVAAVVTCS